MADEERYYVTLHRFAARSTIAYVHDREYSLNGIDPGVVHETHFYSNPVKAAKQARKWIKQRLKADRIADGR